VDDSRRANRERLERLCAGHDVRLLDGGPHVGAKRNLGVAAASHEIVLFVDSDCEASPALLREHWATLTGEGADACAGPVDFVGPRSWLWPAIDLLGLTVTFSLPAVLPRVDWSPTANLSVRRRCFEEVGGFDEGLPSPGGSEDVDLGMRLARRGVGIRCNPRARACHSTSTWSSPLGMMRRLARYGRSEPRLIERHPERSVVVFPGHVTVLAGGILLWLAVGLLGLGGRGALLAVLFAGSYGAFWLGRVLQFGWPEPELVRALAMSAVLDMAHEAGRVAGAWARGRPAWMVRRLVGGESQFPVEWTGGVARSWSWTLATLLCAAVWIALSR
jgi:GT2 family glycosyltransferase